MTQSPAGWYPDPYGTPQLRWWDGSQWTDATHPLEDVAARNAQVGAQAGAGVQGASGAFPDGDAAGGSTGPHGAPQAGTAVEGPPAAPESTGSSSAPVQDIADPDAADKQDAAASGDTGTSGTGTSGTAETGTAADAAAASGDTGTSGTGTSGTGTSGTAETGTAADAASASPSTPSFVPPPAAGDASPTAATVQWASPGAPAGSGAAWTGPGGPPQRGDTAQLPVPDFPAQGKSRPMVPWIAGGVAAAVVIVLLIVGTIYLTGNRGTAGGEGGLASSPTTSAEPPGVEPSPSTGTEGPLPPSAGRVTDRVSGLSYSYPGAPWQLLQPGSIDSGDPSGQQWSSGFQALSQDDYEQGKDWFGSVLAGPLPADAPYGGPDSMRDIAAAFLLGNERALYEPPHVRRIVEDKAITVSGRPGWLLRFEMDFSEQSKANGWKWRKELGAVVLVDRGEANPPSLLFATVPDNLDTGVIDEVISSLRVE